MPRIITLSCPSCGTIVAGNVLQSNREMKCPGLGCEEILWFRDLPENDRNHMIDHRDRYRMDS